MSYIFTRILFFITVAVHIDREPLTRFFPTTIFWHNYLFMLNLPAYMKAFFFFSLSLSLHLFLNRNFMFILPINFLSSFSFFNATFRSFLQSLESKLRYALELYIMLMYICSILLNLNRTLLSSSTLFLMIASSYLHFEIIVSACCLRCFVAWKLILYLFNCILSCLEWLLRGAFLSASDIQRIEFTANCR